ncbi:MAG TPA: protein kinase [Gemmatimonadales bacterium]
MADILEQLTNSLSDRYAIERELGRGGMATVYLARDIRHDREVAIKVLHPELSASIGAERFEREIKLAAKLQHPNILGLYDSGVADKLLYYVMPFIKGESLRDRLDREGQLPIDDAVQITLEVAEALGHAHAAGIVHRDIKPENVLISGGHALVADFGIARAASEGGGQKLTQTGMAVGTPVYMSPEQAVGDPVGPTSDLYSLGCMLYEMLAGEPPFTAKNAQALMARHSMEAVPSVRIVRNTVPEEVEDAIFAAMAKVPADRPQTAAQFMEMLGLPMGATASRRTAIRHTASRRVPTGAQRMLVVEVPWWRRPWVIGVALLLLAGGGFGIWRFVGGGGGPSVDANRLSPKTIAVLYFEDLSPDKSLGYLSDGLTEDLIGALGRVQGLDVISRSGVEQFRTSTLAADSIARILDAGTLLKGTVEQEGGKIRVNVKVLDGNSGADLDRAALELPATDMLAVRDSVTQEVGRLVRTRVGSEVQLRAQREATRSTVAWSLFQQAEQLRKSGEAAAAKNDTLVRNRDFGAADSLLALAESQDKSWADPIVARGLIAYRRSRLSGRDKTVIHPWIRVGLDHVNRALALAPTNADALEIRGNLRYWGYIQGFEPDAEKAKVLLADAQKDLEAATSSNPNQAGAWASLAVVYTQTASGSKVAIAAQRALEADAFLVNADVILFRLFLAQYDLEQFTDADHTCQQIRRRFPRDYGAPRCELFLMTTKVRPSPDVALAWRLADSVAKTAPAVRRQYFELNAHMLVAAVLGRAGLKDSAARVVERSKGDPESNPTRDLALFGAFVYAQLGESQKAIDLLGVYLQANEGLRAGYRDEPGWWFRGIAGDPAFKRLVGAS